MSSTQDNLCEPLSCRPMLDQLSTLPEKRAPIKVCWCCAMSVAHRIVQPPLLIHIKLSPTPRGLFSWRNSFVWAWLDVIQRVSLHSRFQRIPHKLPEVTLFGYGGERLRIYIQHTPHGKPQFGKKRVSRSGLFEPPPTVAPRIRQVMQCSGSVTFPWKYPRNGPALSLWARAKPRKTSASSAVGVAITRTRKTPVPGDDPEGNPLVPRSYRGRLSFVLGC